MTYSFMGNPEIMEVRERVPPLPWRVERYGFSLAQIRAADSAIITDQLNFAIAEFIVEKMNANG